jgi:hypothetical protein
MLSAFIQGDRLGVTAASTSFLPISQPTFLEAEIGFLLRGDGERGQMPAP